MRRLICSSSLLSLFPLLALTALPFANAQEEADTKTTTAAAAKAKPTGDGTSDKYPPGVNTIETPEKALQKFSVAPGLKIDVWAAEPLIANVVAFSFDHRGRAFVAETYRRRTSAPDIRKNMDWLIPDLALRSVPEREAWMKQILAPELKLKPNKDHQDLNGDGQFDWRDWAVESERVKLVEDRAGKGVADTSSVFAEGFNSLVTGTAAGVLAYGDQVWYTAIPDLWRLEGAGGETASSKTKLLTGFGVHVAFGGHDMHGPKMGPDGRVYWTIADTGAHVTTKEGATIEMPDAGAVFRANPDGTELELYAQGLRNPQSLAFNEVGDLFTGDNNADGGDKARWEHVVEGGDYGWRIGWQFLPKLGVWNAEKLWEMDSGSTALSQLPPTGLLGHGPAGVAYYPGTGLPEGYRDHFFMADFPGGVRSFTLKPRGASYLVDLAPEVQLDNKPGNLEGKLIWGLFPSDVQFGVDGGAYVLDWIIGWDKTGKGRIYRVHDPMTDASAVVQRTKKLLAEGMDARPEAELITLLAEPDQRVRQAAQFALAAKGVASLKALGAIAAGASRPPLVARLHAIWAMGQIARRSDETKAYPAIATLLLDAEPEVRAQAAKILGESKRVELGAQLERLLQDPEPRVRFFAALSLSHLKNAARVPALVAMLRDGVAGDSYLRHAAVMALSQCADTAALTALSRDPAESVRAGALLALRRQHSPEVASFLQDGSPQLVLEAARAIHDEPIPAAAPALAAWAGKAGLPAPVSRRAINSAYQVGTEQAAAALAKLAANPAANVASRADALEALAQWNVELGRDRVLGVYRPLPAGRIAKAAGAALEPHLALLLSDASAEVREAAAKATGELELTSGEQMLLTLAIDNNAPAPARLAALDALAKLSSAKLPEAIAAAQESGDAALRKEARHLAASRLTANDAKKWALSILSKGGNSDAAELQGVFETLGGIADSEVDAALVTWLGKLEGGKVPAAAQLELLEAAAKHPAPKVQAALAAYESKRTAAAASNPLARWGECLEGGDAKLGQTIFAEKAEAACMRCHKWKGEGGDVGPDLAGLAKKHDRAYILKSIVAPNADIAEGYETLVLTMKSGDVQIGITAGEDAETITLKPLAGGDRIVVKKADIKQRDKAPSPMPEGLGDVLGRRDLRNVVAFLAGGGK